MKGISSILGPILGILLYISCQTSAMIMYCPDIPYPLGMENGTILNEQISASTEHKQRPAYNARLHHRSAWLGDLNDYKQYLTIEFKETKVVTAVATQGLRGSRNWVQEYHIEYSSDGETWEQVISDNGEQKLFIGNTNADGVVHSYLQYPIIARWIRFNPQRWNGFIAMRVELYGCKYVPYTATFTGDNRITYDMTGPTYLARTAKDELWFRFRTNYPTGLIFYSESSTGDYMAIELIRGILRYSINLGGPNGASETYASSLLDDSQWHDVSIIRDGLFVDIVVDRQLTNNTLKGTFRNLDMDEKISLGGLTSFVHRPGIKVRSNFTGCLENFYFNHMHMIRDANKKLDRYKLYGPQTFHCSVSTITPMTFRFSDSKLVIPGVATANIYRVSLVFRTYNKDGIILYSKLSPSGQLKVWINENGFIEYEIKNVKDSPAIHDIVVNTAKDTGNDEQIFNDGLWHYLNFQAEKNKVNLTIDEQVRVTIQPLNIDGIAGSYYIGGGDDEQEGYQGFLGCMREVYTAAMLVDIEKLDSEQNKGVTIGQCSMRDRCRPNPCEHGGICSQDWGTFMCNCDDTGYMGSVCHISRHAQSCVEVQELHMSSGEKVIEIDLDGSGVIKPFQVKCVFQEKGGIPLTEVSHNSMELTTVDGFQEPGSYRRRVVYTASRPALDLLTERAYSCQQFIQYYCVKSKLLSQPGAEYGGDKRTWGWWVGRSNQPMYHWGNAPPGSDSCYCGLLNTCAKKVDGVSANVKCECDADSAIMTNDNGQLKQKEDLPVMEMYFGDTGSLTDDKYGRHKLGELKCTGDTLYDNVVTFRKADASIEFDTLQFDPRIATDISFQFKTTARDGVLLQNKGPNHFIEVSLFAGTSVSFRYNVGRGVESLVLGVAGSLNNDRWHTVIVERNRKQAYLKVDNNAPEFRDEPQDAGFRLPYLTSKLFIGSTTDYRNGFVGCMRSLQVNGIAYDLRGVVARREVTYGVSEGCVAKCSSNPCINNGDCWEGYSDYYCDCTYTPYRGYICGREVGVELDAGSYVQFDFSSQGTLATEDETIIIGFSTLRKQGILLQVINPDIPEYISVQLNNNGGVKCVFDVGFSQQEVNTDIPGVNLANEQQHVVEVKRMNKGRIVQIKVDDYPPERKDFSILLSDGADTKLHNPKYIYLGHNSTDKKSNGFSGCLYRAKFNNIHPLKSAFRDPPPGNIHLHPADNRKPIRESKCGFEEVLHPPEPQEYRPVPPIDPMATAIPATAASKNYGAIIGGVIAFLILVLIIVIIFVCRYAKAKSGGYETREAKDDGADNPDFAMKAKSSRQPEISAKREYFL
ncbi:neurexin-4-like isoform X2 [Tubulanus polymorphus]|uniref:neurexin-4-like isoform X2 n=1 Tax=Tubulanus polymorphus TaxID=672921 RepID=UPI003DA25116